MYIQKHDVEKILDYCKIDDFARERLTVALNQALEREKAVAARRKEVTKGTCDTIYLFLRDEMNGVPACVFDLTNIFNHKYKADISPQSIGSFLRRMAFQNGSYSNGSIDECMGDAFPNFRTTIVEDRRYYWVGEPIDWEEIRRSAPPKYARSIKSWWKFHI